MSGVIRRCQEVHTYLKVFSECHGVMVSRKSHITLICWSFIVNSLSHTLFEIENEIEKIYYIIIKV